MIATILSGLALGAVYVLVAVGYNLTWLTTRAINFAQGAFMVSGMFITVALYNRNVPVIVIFLILAAVGAVVAAVELFLAISPLLSRGGHGELVTTVGVMTVLQGIILLSTNDDSQRVKFFGPSKLIDVPGGRITPAELFLIALALILGVGAHLWTRYTRAGLAAVALSEDRDAAMILGINTRRFAYGAFAVSGMLGFAVAPFVGPKTFAIVGLASVLAVKGFVVLAIGGVGSQAGALIGGFILGPLELLVAREFSGTYQNMAVFLVFILVMMVKPRGLFGEREERMV